VRDFAGIFLLGLFPVYFNQLEKIIIQSPSKKDQSVTEKPISLQDPSPKSKTHWRQTSHLEIDTLT